MRYAPPEDGLCSSAMAERRHWPEIGAAWVSSEGSRVVEPNTGQDATAHELPALLDIATVARMLSCSVRHVHRLRDSRRMPHPIKLGALVRWRLTDIEEWVAEGCPSCRRRRR